jgi:hypothetical protein
MNKTFDQMMNEFDASVDNIIEIARAASLLSALRTNSPTPSAEPATSPMSVAAPITPSSKSLPSVSSKSHNMKRAILAKPAPKRITCKLSQAELDARKASDNSVTRWRAADVENRRKNRKLARDAREAGDPIAVCGYTKERVQEALKPSQCINPQLPRSVQDEFENAHAIIEIHGPEHADYRISCGRMYALRDVLAAKTAVLALKHSDHMVARIEAFRALLVDTDVVLKTAKQLLGL